MKVSICIGTRPNMIKVTQFKRLQSEFPNIDVELIHTGQHFDHKMANIFFEQFDMFPDHRITLAAKDSAGQIGEMMMKLSSHFAQSKPDIVLVPGDVNSTLAAALTAYKLSIPVGHIESGLRSFDRTMPEELNRILTDEISDIFFVTEQSGMENLKSEGKPGSRIHFVGNTMIDTLVSFDSKIEESSILRDLELEKKSYALLTFHRPSNVDTYESQVKLLSLIRGLASRVQCVFPVHPRTRQALEKSDLWNELTRTKNLITTQPLGYFEFQKLVKYSTIVVTDSGGIQEETTFRHVPCITLRPNTERPVTTTLGTNVLLPFEHDVVLEQLEHVEDLKARASIPDLWDGQSSYRILKVLQGV